MSICLKSLRFLTAPVLLLVLMVVFLGATDSQAQTPIMHVFVGDTTGPAGEQNSVITCYLDNWEDTIAAFQMWLLLERPGIMFFQTDTIQEIDTTYWKCLAGTWPDCTDSVAGEHDTTYWRCVTEDPPGTCVDSVRVAPDEPHDTFYLPDWDFFEVDSQWVTIGNIDTAGTLLSGWEELSTRSFIGGDSAQDVRITGRANANFTDGVNTKGIPAGQAGGILFRLLGDVEDIDDTVQDRSVDINVLANPANYFIFSDPDAQPVGLAYEQFIDTNYYYCQIWSGDDCLSWQQVSLPPYDSIYVHPDSTAFVDTLVGFVGQVWLEHGSMTVNAGTVCGDLNPIPDDLINLADITRLISIVYLNGDPTDPVCISNVDCSEDDKINLGDITRMIDKVYVSKLPLCAGCCY